MRIKTIQSCISKTIYINGFKRLIHGPTRMFTDLYKLIFPTLLVFLMEIQTPTTKTSLLTK